MFASAATKARQLGKDESGAIAIMFGLCSMVLFVVVALALDIGRTMHSRARIASSIDAAALAAAKGMRLEGLTKDQAIALAKAMFKENIAATSGKWTVIDEPDVQIDDNTGEVTVAVDAHVPTVFATVIGIERLSASKSGAAIFEAKDIEVALQLDVTGSMCMPCTKISALRAATEEFINIVIPSQPTGQKVRVGLAPFAGGVNAGAYFQAVNGNRAGNGCVYERLNVANQTYDMAPTGANALKITADLGPNPRPCPPVNPVVAMTENKPMLVNSARALVTDSYTAGHLGTAWAWYLLAPTWQSVWNLATPAAAYSDAKTSKIAVLMTDGQYNTVGGQSGNEAQSDLLARNTCAAMRAQGITIYTVAFQAPQSAKDTLEDCAASAERALLAEDAAELKIAFRKIAHSIVTLRVSK